MMKIWVITLSLLMLLPYRSAWGMARKDIVKLMDLFYDGDNGDNNECKDDEVDPDLSPVENSDFEKDYNEKIPDYDFSRQSDTKNAPRQENEYDSRERDLLKLLTDVESYIARKENDFNDKRASTFDRFDRDSVEKDVKALEILDKDDGIWGF